MANLASVLLSCALLTSACTMSGVAAQQGLGPVEKFQRLMSAALSRFSVAASSNNDVEPATAQGGSSPGDGVATNLGSVKSFGDTGEVVAEAWEQTRLKSLLPRLGLQPQKAGGINKEQAAAYAQLVITEKVKVICETGFFRGGSALLWLMAAPEAHLHTFDLTFNPQARAFFEENFPGRITFHEGNSAVTLPEFVSAVTKGTFQPCEFASVDGNHAGDGPYLDIVNLSKATQVGSTLVADDTFNCTTSKTHCEVCGPSCACDSNRPFCNACSEGFSKNVVSGVLKRTHCESFGTVGYSWTENGSLVNGYFPVGFCAGKLLRAAS